MEALAYARDGRLAEWVDRFLTDSRFTPNFEMAEQLRQPLTFWRGPILSPLEKLVRICGPEQG